MAAGDWTRALFDAIDDAVFVHDEAGKILEANAAACRRLGFSRAELLGMNTRQIDAPEFAREFGARLEHQFSEGAYRCEGVHRTKDGRLLPVDINTSFVEIEGQKVVLAVMRDITRKKQILETLAQQRRLLQSVLDSMGEAIFVVDGAGNVVLENPIAGEWLGPRGLDQPFFRADLHTPAPETPLARCLRGEAFDDETYGLRPTPEHPGLWLSMSGRLLHDLESPGSALLVARDISAQVRAQRRQAINFGVARALAESSSLPQAARLVLEVLAEGFMPDVAVMWVVDAGSAALRCVDLRQAPGLELREFAILTRRIALPAGADLPGQVWDRQTPQTAEISPQNSYDRPFLAARAGLRYALAFPVHAEGEVLGVMELLARTPYVLDAELESLMQALGNQIGQAVQRFRFETALRDSEALYQSLVESLPQNILRKDLHGRFTFGNRLFCNILKIDPKDLLGKTDFDFFPRELAAKYVQDDLQILQSGKPLEIVESHRLPDGSTIYVQVMKTPIFDAQGKVVGVQGIFWDVTARKRAEEVLANSERRYRQLTEATLDGIVLVDRLGVMLLFNPAAEKMFGYRADEVVGKSVAMLVPDDLKGHHHDCFQRYLSTRAPKIIGIPQELTGRRKDGSIFPVEIALSVLALEHDSSSDGPLQFLGAVRDLTERNRIRTVLVQNEKLASIGLLSAGVAHEINNPLAFVGNNLAVLQRDTKGFLTLLDYLDQNEALLTGAAPAFWQRYRELYEELDLEYLRNNITRLFDRSRDGVDRVSRIVSSLRGMARTDSPKRQDVGIPELVESSLEILHGKYKRAGIQVVQDHDPDAKIVGVATQISQVVLNILVNAFQAIESHRKEGGEIRISTRRVGNELVFEVADNGPGIPTENLPKVFDPFFTTKDVGEGTGLGLSISHHIILAHGGRMEVHSQPGEGATFRIVLPTS